MRKKLFLIAFSAVVLFSQCGSGDNSKKVSPEIKAGIEKINDYLPMKIGDVITMDSARMSDDGELKYYYTFTQTPVVTDLAVFEEKTVPQLIYTAKGPDMKIFRDSNISLHFIYNNPDGSLYHEVVITPDMYKE